MTADNDTDNREPVWIHKHVHEPNPDPPTHDPDIVLRLPNQHQRTVSVADLDKLPQYEVSNCYIVSTGHGTSGPFSFSGVRLEDFVAAYVPPDTTWNSVDVVSEDGFGNRVFAGELMAELTEDEDDRPMLLATRLGGQPMTRAQGLVRLIVPSEIDDALRQVKWIGRIEFRA